MRPCCAVIPIRDAARGLAGNDAGIELPLQFAGCGIKRDDFGLRRVGVQRAADDERVGLDAAFLAGVIGPCLLELMDVVASDLGERGVVVAVEAAVVDGPVSLRLRKTVRSSDKSTQREMNRVTQE